MFGVIFVIGLIPLAFFFRHLDRGLTAKARAMVL
jgi:hypothetical protein